MCVYECVCKWMYMGVCVYGWVCIQMHVYLDGCAYKFMCIWNCVHACVLQYMHVRTSNLDRALYVYDRFVCAGAYTTRMPSRLSGAYTVHVLFNVFDVLFNSETKR